MKPIRVGVIGIGHMGSLHARKYAAMPDVELVGVRDIDKDKAIALARECGCRILDDFYMADVDAVSVCTPVENHFRISRDLLRREIDVLIEKPIASTVEEADHLIMLAEIHHLILQVGHIERFNPLIPKLAMGDLSHVEIVRNSPYTERVRDIGVVMDLMIHDIDLVLSWNSSPITSLFAESPDKGVDSAFAQIYFDNNFYAHLRADRRTLSTVRGMYIGNGMYIDFNGNYGDPLANELRAFIHSVRTRKKPLVTGEVGKAALKVAIKITSYIKGELCPTSR